MKDQRADYKTSKMLKELGFDEECFGFFVKPFRNDDRIDFLYNYTKQGILFKHNSDSETKNWNDPNCKCSAPLWQQVKQWLWEKHDIFIEVVDVSTQDESIHSDKMIGIIEFEYAVKIKEEYIEVNQTDSPITAEIEGIKKAVQYLYETKNK